MSEATYKLFHQTHNAEGEWTELGDPFGAESHHAALAEAAQRAQRSIEEDGADTIEVTVAAVSDRFWNEGTATVELKPVTTWARP